MACFLLADCNQRKRAHGRPGCLHQLCEVGGWGGERGRRRGRGGCRETETKINYRGDEKWVERERQEREIERGR